MLGGPKEKPREKSQILETIPQMLAERKALRNQVGQVQDQNRIAAIKILGEAGNTFEKLFKGELKRE